MKRLLGPETVLPFLAGMVTAGMVTLAMLIELTSCATGTFTGTQDAPPPSKCVVIRAADGVAISCNYGRP